MSSDENHAVKVIDGSLIEREARIPDKDIRALRDVGAFGRKPHDHGARRTRLRDRRIATCPRGACGPR